MPTQLPPPGAPDQGLGQQLVLASSRFRKLTAAGVDQLVACALPSRESSVVSMASRLWTEDVIDEEARFTLERSEYCR